MCNALSDDSKHECDGGSESKVMHRCPFAVGACFAVPLFIHPGIFQVISQPRRGKVIVAVQAQGSILFVTVGEGNPRT